MSMKLINQSGEIFIPDDSPFKEAIERTTHMSIAAHQDDIEIMAYDGIIKCYQTKDNWFMGVVVTNGAGSPRDGDYKNYTDSEMQVVRKEEQKKAASIGEYGALALLDYPSKDVKDPNNYEIIVELANIISKAKPEIIYTHNLADKHSTHLGVVTKVIKAIRTLKNNERPKQIYGCEVWRDLDWINDNEKITFDVSKNPDLAQKLVSSFDSQIAGGKRYDLATIGRRLANATYSSFNTVDKSNAVIHAMDLTPLINDYSLDIVTYVTEYIDRFKKDVEERIKEILE